MYFFNTIEDVLAKKKLSLGKLTIWETPNKGIEITSRFMGFSLKGNPETTEPVEETYELIAATSDNSADHEPPEEENPPVGGESSCQDPLEEDCPSDSIQEEKALENKRPVKRIYSFFKFIFAFSLICLVVFVTYSNVLLTPPATYFPWGSDTWGHLYKAEFLFHQIQQGDFFPQFDASWYNGNQPFRYWAPLPYYLLALIRAISGDIFHAGIFYIFVCALFGGVSWLFFAKRMGLWPATLAGIVWTVWLDNVRVAFSEGNLPRVLATALLPLLIIAYMRVLDKRKAYFGIIATVVLVQLAVLSHAMIAAVFLIGLALFTLFYRVFHGCRLRDGARGILVLLVGVLSSGWWLLPSLSGGITGLDPEAVKNAIQFIPANVSLNPMYRFANWETFYWGVSLIVAGVVTFLTWRSKPAWAKSLAACGAILVLITFPLVRPVYISLPFSNLLWPLRFSSVAALAFLASSMAFHKPELRRGLLKSSYVTGSLIVGLFAILFVDSLLSMRLLAYTGGQPDRLEKVAQVLQTEPGWRVETLDLSTLGSAPSYLFSTSPKLEQVFGWAWQGAETAQNIMLLNSSFETQHYPFLFGRSEELGTTDLVVKDDAVKDAGTFASAAASAGYRRQATIDGVSIWHGGSGPYLVAKDYNCLAIGKYASIVAMQFPSVEIGGSNNLNDYSLDDLKKYPEIVLTGVEWRVKSAAEKVIADYVSSGGRVVIDLAGMPNDVLSKQPEFLGVSGETATLQGQLEINTGAKTVLLQPFSEQYPQWKSFIPQGLDGVEMSTTYYGNTAPIFGYKLVNGQKVWFLGGNLIYHSYLTGDPVALKLESEQLALQTEFTGLDINYLTDYKTTRTGYVMKYHSDNSFAAVMPVAALDGMNAAIDGTPSPLGKHENLVQLDLPAGDHTISLSLKKTPIFYWGEAISLFSLFVLAAAIVYLRIKRVDV